MFVAWQNVFCVLFEGEDCHNTKRYQPLKDTGKTKDMAASYSKCGFTLETDTDLSW